MMTGSSWHCYANAIQNPQTTKPWHFGQDGWGSVVVPLRRGQTCRANSTPTDQHNSSICYHGDVFMSCSNSEAWTPGHDWEELLSSSPLPPPLSGGIKNFVIWYRTVSKKHSVNSNVLNHLSTSLYLPLILQLKQNKQQLDETPWCKTLCEVWLPLHFLSRDQTWPSVWSKWSQWIDSPFSPPHQCCTSAHMRSTASQTILLSFPPIMPALLVKLSYCAQYDLQPHIHTHTGMPCQTYTLSTFKSTMARHNGLVYWLKILNSYQLKTVKNSQVPLLLCTQAALHTICYKEGRLTNT